MEELNNYFETITEPLFSKLFENAKYPWDSLDAIRAVLDEFFIKSDIYSSGLPDAYCYLSENNEGSMESSIYINSPITLTKDISVKGMDIFLGEGTQLEPGAMIKSPAIIGKDCQIRQGAYIRGNVIVGNRCVVGHTTEVKNSILFDGVEAGHFAYIGDSVLGCGVNLGAGTKLANLQLRKKSEKQTGDIREIVIFYKKNKYFTGRKKLGAIIGDWSEIGCNTVTSPGVLLSKNTWIFPNVTVSKGFYPSGSILRK